MVKSLSIWTCCLFSLSFSAFGQFPQQLSYQGLLVTPEGLPVTDGSSHTVRFVFYDAPAGGVVRYETSSFNVTTFKGLFTTIIGNSQPTAAVNPPIPLTIWDTPIYVEIIANGMSLGRVPLTSTPFAFKAHTANTIDAGNLTGVANLPNTVLDIDLQDLADGSLSGSRVGSGIDAANITNTLAVANGGTGATTVEGIRVSLGLVVGTDVQAADADLTDLADGTLDGSKVGAGVDANNITVNALAIANGGTAASTAETARTNLGLAIGTDIQAFDADLSDLADGTLTGSTIGSGIDAANITVNALAIANGGTGATTVADVRSNLGLGSLALLGSITSTEITDFSVSTDDIANRSVTPAKLQTAGAADGNRLLITDGNGDPQWTTNLNGNPVVTGSGTAGQLSYWTGSNTQSASPNLYWNNTTQSLAIGHSNPAYSLDIAGATSARSIQISQSYAGTSAQYGLSVEVNPSGTGSKYGVSSNLFGTTGSTSPLHGFYSNVTPSGSNAPVYGVYSVLNAGGSGVRYGVYSSILSDGTNGSFNTGVYSSVQGTGSGNHYGLRGYASGTNHLNYGVFGEASGTGAFTHTGVYGYASGGNHTNYGVFGFASGGTTNYAGYFAGDVYVSGTLSKASGTFKIDHPMDPENKYLYHSFVESPDMMNVYNGNATTDHAGRATVELPLYFEKLNKDYRYQLTVIGTFAQAIVEQEVADNKFVIATDKPGVRVSWQITGIRKDPYAEKNRVVPEVDKVGADKGKYLNPEAYGAPKEMGIGFLLPDRGNE